MGGYIISVNGEVYRGYIVSVNGYMDPRESYMGIYSIKYIIYSKIGEGYCTTEQ